MSHRRNHPSKSADRVPRKVTSLLNQLAVSNFDSISGQIVAIADQAEGEGDARTLVSLTRVLYDTAISQPMRAELYARLCRHLMKQISHKVQDDDAKDAEGKPITGGLLFLRYLLGRLETGLEKGFPTEDLPDEPETETPRRLGLVRFMGEVFKLQMSTERMMHECIKKLLRIKKSLGQADPPLGAILEALYVLLHSVGALLDTQKAAPHMAVYFSRIRELSSHSEIPLRLRFMLVDLIDLRARNWTSAPRTGSDDPIPTPLDRDIDEESHLGDAESAILADKIKDILVKEDLKHAERQLSSLRPWYIPTAIQILAELVLLDSASAPFVSKFLASASAQDLVFTTDIALGCARALAGAMAPILVMLKAAGLSDDRATSILAGGFGGRTAGADDEHIDVHPLGAKGSKSTSRIGELEMALARERQETSALRSQMERLSDQLAESVEDNQKLAQENEVVRKTRNAEQMRRVEMEDRLKAERVAVLNLQDDLQQAQGRCQILEAVVQRSSIDEGVRRNVEISAMNAGREEGRDGMLTELIRLLTSKREDERRAREAEAERADRERAEKIRHEAEAKRKAEQQRGAERERSRCLKRDEKYTGSRLWTAALAFERFETILLVEEFAKFKFSDSTPLTFEALPWPVLSKPWTYNVNDINADKVRIFFTSTALKTATSPAYPVPSEYRKYLLKQSLLAFHGDKMVHRISTVGDENLRQQISDAAHMVTQTLNELMQRDA